MRENLYFYIRIWYDSSRRQTAELLKNAPTTTLHDVETLTVFYVLAFIKIVFRTMGKVFPRHVITSFGKDVSAVTPRVGQGAQGVQFGEIESLSNEYQLLWKWCETAS